MHARTLHLHTTVGVARYSVCSKLMDEEKNLNIELARARPLIGRLRLPPAADNIGMTFRAIQHVSITRRNCLLSTDSFPRLPIFRRCALAACFYPVGHGVGYGNVLVIWYTISDTSGNG